MIFIPGPYSIVRDYFSFLPRSQLVKKTYPDDQPTDWHSGVKSRVLFVFELKLLYSSSKNAFKSCSFSITSILEQSLAIRSMLDSKTGTNPMTPESLLIA